MEIFGISVLELFGYMGSFVVLLSLTMNSIVRLRWINLLGATMFAIYALMIKAYPAFVMNVGIMFIDVYYLQKLYRLKKA